MLAQGGATSVRAVVAQPWETSQPRAESPNGAALTGEPFTARATPLGFRCQSSSPPRVARRSFFSRRSTLG